MSTLICGIGNWGILAWATSHSSAVVGGRRYAGVGVVDGLEGAVANVLVPAMPVLLLGLHALVDKPERVDVAWEVAEDGQADVDEEVTGTASDEGGCGGGEDNGDQDEEDIRAFHHGVCWWWYSSKRRLRGLGARGGGR